MVASISNTELTYIDLFSGCGGLSLGLGNAGWKGLFAVEKDPMAFETFRHNLIDGRYAHFEWPKWLDKKATTIQSLLKNKNAELKALKGKVDLIAGGPPCQGFSSAGRRDPNDPRNKLSQQYISLVKLVLPRFLLLENVKGFQSKFSDVKNISGKTAYSEIVVQALSDKYKIYTSILSAKRFGVPQNRQRFILIGIRRDIFNSGDANPFELLEALRGDFLKSKGLPQRPVTLKSAIGDLEITKSNAQLVHHSGSQETGFKQLNYRPPYKMNAYQKLMREGLGGQSPNSLRLARHRMQTIEKFKIIQSHVKPGGKMDDVLRELLGTKKQMIGVLDPASPSRTITTLPDDLLHYKEPRILTVRENARIQSFPDGFAFTGKYTTGGKRRKQECPRYTQVGNAVPPLMGEALGYLVKAYARGIYNGD